MHYDRHADFSLSVKFRDPPGRHIDAAMASVGSPDTAAEAASPAGIVEADPCRSNTHPVGYRRLIVVAFENHVSQFVHDKVCPCRRSVATRLISCCDAAGEFQDTVAIKAYFLSAEVYVGIGVAEKAGICAVAFF